MPVRGAGLASVRWPFSSAVFRRHCWPFLGAFAGHFQAPLLAFFWSHCRSAISPFARCFQAPLKGAISPVSGASPGAIEGAVSPVFMRQFRRDFRRHRTVFRRYIQAPSHYFQAPLPAPLKAPFSGSICWLQAPLSVPLKAPFSGAISWLQAPFLRCHQRRWLQAPLEALFAGAVFLPFAVPFKVRFRHPFQALQKCHFRR